MNTFDKISNYLCNFKDSADNYINNLLNEKEYIINDDDDLYTKINKFTISNKKKIIIIIVFSIIIVLLNNDLLFNTATNLTKILKGGVKGYQARADRYQMRKHNIDTRSGEMLANAAGKAGRAALRAGNKAVEGFKAFSTFIYLVLFQIAIFAVTCLILGPAVGFTFIAIVSFALLKKKILYLKSL